MNWAIVIAAILFFAFLDGLYTEAETKAAKTFEILAKCMSEPTTIRVGNEIVSECTPRKK